MPQLNPSSSAEQLVGLLHKLGKTIAVAESCTGGMIAQLLTAVPGASQVFRVGIAAYGNEAKSRELHVPRRLIQKYGAVSKEVAISMAYHIMEKDESDYGIGVTGIAGPDGAVPGKPVGTVWIAVCSKKSVAVRLLDLSEAERREQIREQTAAFAFTIASQHLEGLDDQKTAVSSLRAYRRCIKPSPVVSFFRFFLPWKGDKALDILMKLALIAVVAVGAWAVVELGQDSYQDYQTAVTLEKAVEALEQPPTEEAVSQLPEGYLSKFAALYEINDDVVGWITIPNTAINLPVVQSDDNEYYLNHNLYKEDDKNGLPFMDFRNTLPELCNNTLIYGHNMDGQMFENLTRYRSLDFYKENPVISFDTVYEESQWKVISCFEATTDPNVGQIFNYFNFVKTQNPERVQWYIDEITARSYFLTDVDVNIDDHFLTLQTCVNDRYNTKICLVARKVREGEDVSVNTENAVENPNRVLPHRY
jgi:SrtB family sortase